MDYRATNARDCGNKKVFTSYRQAAEFNNRMKKRGSVLRAKGKKIEKLRIYQCFNCHQFHIGHATKNRQKFRL